MNSKFFTLLVLGVFCGGATSFAQSQEPEYRFRALSWNNDITGIYYLDGLEKEKKKQVALDVYGHARTALNKYHGEKIIQFFRPATEPGAEPKVVAEADLSQGGESPLLLFFDDLSQAGNYKIQCLPDDVKSFPLGTYKFANYATGPVRIDLGSDSILLKPKEYRAVRGKPRTLAGVPNMLDVHIYNEQGSQPVQVYGNIWAYDPTLRGLVFIVQQGNGLGVIEAKRIMDDPNFVPIEPKENKEKKR